MNLHCLSFTKWVKKDKGKSPLVIALMITEFQIFGTKDLSNMWISFIYQVLAVIISLIICQGEKKHITVCSVKNLGDKKSTFLRCQSNPNSLGCNSWMIWINALPWRMPIKDVLILWTWKSVNKVLVWRERKELKGSLRQSAKTAAKVVMIFSLCCRYLWAEIKLNTI